MTTKFESKWARPYDLTCIRDMSRILSMCCKTFFT